MDEKNVCMDREKLKSFIFLVFHTFYISISRRRKRTHKDLRKTLSRIISIDKHRSALSTAFAFLLIPANNIDLAPFRTKRIFISGYAETDDGNCT